ncbi:MAG TPA: 3-phosphoshikimate 1-carboxyvinyltransferase [Actinomycetota bacterium]|jgi:3-phosphoshikimate 1-carboxyvinyltransferase|nr:3-phosphoshikimate 1-carboxyvinyltransferase [Actinomycetota bacterium]
MRVRINPGAALAGSVSMPGDKSIAHRLLILAATARGRSRLSGLPPSLDVLSSARCLAEVSLEARPGLDAWAREISAQQEGHGFTWNIRSDRAAPPPLEVEGKGRTGLIETSRPLDCGNSGTAMRLLAGVLAAAPFRTVLEGDASLSRRPMERVAEPLRSMGASVATTDGHAPVTVDGGNLSGILYEPPMPSAQLKSAVLLAGIAAEGQTTVVEAAPTRDHTERALRALGGAVRIEGTGTTVERFQHPGFDAHVPGDLSSAAFLIAAAALTASSIEIGGVGLNPTRTRFLDVMERMGVSTQKIVEHEILGEPVGTLRVLPGGPLRGTSIPREELPLVIDEVPVLAALAAHSKGETWFLGAAELRLKESDRLQGLSAGVRALGGHAGDEGDDLVVAGTGLPGGVAHGGGDHRLAMSFVVASLAADRPCEIDGMEVADVSFPGFLRTLRGLGADLELSA